MIPCDSCACGRPAAVVLIVPAIEGGRIPLREYACSACAADAGPRAAIDSYALEIMEAR